MSRSVALLSGKGGSGKTTLALSMASLLSSCEIKVLLVDCDLSTNGATFFYENRLSREYKNITSFSDILDGINKDNELPIKINKHFHFIPSITQINKGQYKEQYYAEDELSNFEDYINTVRFEYDVILYDCQAGYTKLLDTILRLSDVNLIVMEADAISSASIRTLYLKIANIVGDRKMYQLFNKVTNEEYEIYSKISGGTFFTNVATIVFDWRIRKAFSIAQVPDMESTSYRYGEEIHELCKILFPTVEYQERLHKFEVKLKLHKINEKEKELQKSIEDLRKDRLKQKRRTLKNCYLLLMPIMVSMILIIVWRMLNTHIYFAEGYDVFVSILTALVSVLTLIFTLFGMAKDQKSHTKEYDIAIKELYELDLEKNKLQKIAQKIN